MISRWLRREGEAGADTPRVEVVETAPAPTTPEDPGRLTRSEAVYGYVVALELLVVAILNLVVTHGKGAPKHPDTVLAVIGVLAAVALVPVLQLRKRTVAAFAAILAAFFVTLPPVPTRLSFYHFFALLIAAGWGLLVASRRRKAEKSLRAAGGGVAARTSQRSGRPDGRSRRSRKGAPEPSGPQANRRYTPPKARRKVSGG